ncbi:NAD(P)H-dependent oxidoreductase [Streptomyces sp. NPDC051985]|uniref:NADPH-dependent FMN reductase n=1 Tax=Streptomyces sp. NPDC051985 TaxID=3155807 RepID=UPI00341FE01C
MGAEKMRILAIGGTTRQGSNSERALRVAADEAERAGAVVELLTGRALMLPIYDPESTNRTREAVALVEALRGADGLLVSSPGYHGTVSGMMKNVLDYVEDLRRDSRPYLADLPIGCIAVAYGWQASVSTLHTLRTCAHALRGWPTPLGVALNATMPGLFDQATGACADEASRLQLETVGRQVVEFASARKLSSAADALAIG